MGLASGLGAAGAGMTAFGNFEGMEAQSQAAAYQAQVAQYNSMLARQTASYDSQAAQADAVNQGLRTRQAMGRYVAGEGASGADVNTGSVQDTARGIQSTGMLDAMNIRSAGAQKAYGAQVKSWADQQTATLDRYASNVAGTLAPLSLLGGGLTAGGKLLGGSTVGA